MMLATLSAVTSFTGTTPPLVDDMARARMKLPRSHLAGGSIKDMLAKMNTQLQRVAPVPTAACEDFSHAQLVSLLETLHAERNPEFEAIYRTDDDNRRMQAGGVKTDDIVALRREWDAEKATLAANPSLHAVARDGRCYDAVMWWVHHVPSDAKQKLATTGAVARLPLMPLPELPHSKAAAAQTASRGATNKVFDNYKASTGCAACHAAGATAGNTEAKEWPASLSYNATGYGAFPFWDNTGAGCTYCNPSVSTAAKLSVKYSATLNSELLMHSNCGDMSWTGSSSAPKNSPCNHLCKPRCARATPPHPFRSAAA